MDRLITVTDIEKRRKLRSIDEQYSSFPIMEYRRLSDAMMDNHSDVEYLIHEYYHALDNQSVYSNGEYLLKPFEILKETPEIAEKRMIKEMIPLLSKIRDFYSLEQSLDDISEIDSIVEEVNLQKACDRFLNNDERLNKRFDLQKFFLKNRLKSLEFLVQETCKLIDTYDIPKYGKFQCTIEEMIYQLDRLGCKYKVESLLEGVADFYITDANEYDDIIQVVNESKFISPKLKKQFSKEAKKEKERLAKVEVEDDDGAKVKYIIDKFKKSETKDMGKLHSTLYNLSRKDPQSIVDGIPSIMGALNVMLNIGIIAINPFLAIIALPAKIVHDGMVNEKSTKKMIAALDKEKKKLNKQLSTKGIPQEKRKEIKEVIKAIDNATDQMWDYRYEHYGDSKPYDEGFSIEENVYEYHTLKESVEDLSSDIVTIHEFQNREIPNMIKTEKAIFSYLNRRDDRYNFLKEHCSLVYRNDIKMNRSIIEEGYISNDNLYVDSCILICESDEESITAVADILEDACDIINSTNVNPIALYIEGYDNILEMHMVNGVEVLMDKEIHTPLSDRDYFYLESFSQYAQPEFVDLIEEGVDLSSIKLGIMGILQKGKDLTSKAREQLRDLSSAVNNFSQSVKQADKADRREQIIKGSVIPSFSKCIKMAIPLVGLGIINPLLSIIAGFGALARSKSLNREEKNMMIDELEVELKVIDKEIEKADSSGDTTKYRKLLLAKKRLQREKVRLSYGLKGSKHHLDENPLIKSEEKDD